MTTVDLARHFVSVAAVISDGHDRVLAIRRRDNGCWEPPGGMLQSGEHIEDGLVREVAEEAGVEVDLLRLSGIYRHVDRDIVSFVYHCRVRREIATDWAETVGVQWLDRDEVVARMRPVFVTRVLDALDGGPAGVPAVRHHDGSAFLDSTSRSSVHRDEPVASAASAPPAGRRARRSTLRGLPLVAALTVLCGIAIILG